MTPGSCDTMVALGRATRQMTIEAVGSIMSGDNPHIVRHKMSTFYLDSPEPLGKCQLADTSLEDLQARLQHTPFSEMTWDQLSDLYVAMGFLALCEGIAALAPLVELADHPFLKRSLELMTDGSSPTEAIRILEEQMNAELREVKTLHEMIVVGLNALQCGADPEGMEQALHESIP